LNRSLTSLGLGILIATLLLLAFPIIVFGHEAFDLEQQMGLVGLPVGLLVILFGAASPDPRLTTVGGAFGNPDENILRREGLVELPTPAARFIPGPRESVNCRHCYTGIPPGSLTCPRCTRPRDCRSCHRPLTMFGRAIRCLRCQRDEVFCNCPKLVRTPTMTPGTRTRRI
jgi:hypothetical protein